MAEILFFLFLLNFIVPNINNSFILCLRILSFSFAKAVSNRTKYSGWNFLERFSKLFSLINLSSFKISKPTRAFDIFDLTPLFGLMFLISFFENKPKFSLFVNFINS